jgi:hypothetical protein
MGSTATSSAGSNFQRSALAYALLVSRVRALGYRFVVLKNS